MGKGRGKWNRSSAHDLLLFFPWQRSKDHTAVPTDHPLGVPLSWGMV